MLVVVLLFFFLSVSSAELGARQSVPSTYPPGMSPDYIPSYNAMYTYIIQNVNYMTALIPAARVRASSNVCLELYNRGYIDFFAIDEFKLIVKQSCESTYALLQATNQILLIPPTSTGFASRVGQATVTNLNNMLTTTLLQYNIDQANSDGIHHIKVEYVVLSVLSIFRENAALARQAYEDVYPANKDLVKVTSAIDQATFNWISAILARYALLVAGTTTIAEVTTTTTDTTTKTTTEVTTTTTDTTTETTTEMLTTTTADVTTAPSPSNPVELSIAPMSGSGWGGTDVTITGFNFLGATQVMFGNNPAPSFVVASDAIIHAVSPPGQGIVVVRVIKSTKRSMEERDVVLFTYGELGTE